MKFTVLSLFPEILSGFFNSSIMAKSQEKGLVSYRLINFRDFALDKHRTADDSPYGGGAGMVLKPDPIAAALESLGSGARRILYMSPSGKPFNQALAAELASESELVLICGRYEGLDQRIIDEYVDDEVSVGDYVLSSGETAALVVIDAVYRLLEGVINAESLKEESHCGGLLEYPHYTRPEIFHGRRVPEVLLSGNHAHIRKWRLEQSLQKTLLVRPDLLASRVLSKEEQNVLQCVLTQGGKDGSCEITGAEPAEGKHSRI
jgi:tRNA (guanine37-N1)-methyltransferase